MLSRSVSALGDRVLRLGDTGPDVAALQELLKVEQTGTFDAATRKTVKKVQRSAGIKANGRGHGQGAHEDQAAS